ncbi:MAG: hypothetical protein FWF10_01490 [Clostridiales bacterium]|nr:hypothetical protein [Clostridiales bacterium]
METKTNMLLKVTGILMIIGGAIAIIVGIIAVAGVGLLAATLRVASWMLTLAALLSTVGAVMQLVAGIAGAKNAARPEKAMTCIALGIIVVLLSVAGNVLTCIWTRRFDFLGWTLGLALPAVYLIGAFQNHRRAA